MLGWYRAAPPAGRRAFWATFGGWGLEAADAQVFGLVLPTLMALWHLSEGQGGLLASVTLVCTALGGWLAGAASDRWGRVRVLQVTIAWYALATALVGFATGFGSLLALRCVQGFGFGGEWAAGAVLISEYVGVRYRAGCWAPCRAAGRWAGASRWSHTRWCSAFSRSPGDGG